jgi:predicted amidohydrolase
LTADSGSFTLEEMKVAYVQFQPVFGRVAENIEKARSMMSGIDADIVVLPELCFTGYAFVSPQEAESYAESAGGGFSLKRMKELSENHNCGIVFGFPEKDGAGVYNSCAFVAPGAKTRIYRKLHLYYFEKDWFRPGDKPLDIFEFRDCKVGMMICFDWIFPETVRTLGLMGADLICHPANLVMPYCQDAMVIRCLENRVFAVTANRTGREKRGDFDFEFTGKSQIVSVNGEIISRGSRDKDETAVADIDFRTSREKAINRRNDLWADRRPEFYRMESDGKDET